MSKQPSVPPALPSAQQHLDDDGYVLLPKLIPQSLLAELRQHVELLFEREGDQAGSEIKQEAGSRRLANLMAKGSVFWPLLTDPRVLPLVQHVLNGEAKLSSLNVRSVNANWDQPQPLHCDMGAIADEAGFWVCNVVWMLDDFTLDNGPLRVVPGSHRWGRLPQQELHDPTAEHPRQNVITGEAGSAIVLNAHAWHGGMANHTSQSRTAIHAFYCRRDKPQQQYQKSLLPAHIQRELSDELRELLAIDDADNDRLATQQTQRSGFLK